MHSTTTSGFVALIVFFASSDTLTRSVAADTGDLAEIASGLRRIDVDRADDLESLAPIATCFTTAAPIGPEPEMQDFDRSLACRHL